MKKKFLACCLFLVSMVGVAPAMAQMKTESYFFFGASTPAKTSDVKNLLSSIVAAYLSETAFLKATQERVAPMYFGEWGPNGFNRFTWLVPNGVQLPSFSLPFAPGFLDKANWDVVISGIQAPVMGSNNAYLRITIKF